MGCPGRCSLATLLFANFQIGSCHVSQTGLKFAIPLPHTPTHWEATAHGLPMLLTESKVPFFSLPKTSGLLWPMSTGQQNTWWYQNDFPPPHPVMGEKLLPLCNRWSWFFWWPKVPMSSWHPWSPEIRTSEKHDWGLKLDPSTGCLSYFLLPS